MKRQITSPRYYQGDSVVDLGSATVSWDFTTDKDIKFAATNDLNAAAQTECDYTFMILETITAEFATNVYQVVVDPEKDNVCWHYDMSFQGSVGHKDVLIIPYVTAVITGAADSQIWQQLPITSSASYDLQIQMASKGTIVRRKKGVSSDDQNLAFGLLFWNRNGSGQECEGMGHVSIHPNTNPLTIADPGL